jgi:uncharacterized RDD family membrane protein YckC
LESNSSSSAEAATRRVEYVGFWKRVVATVIDILILLVVVVPALLAIYGLEYPAQVEQGAFAGLWAGAWDFVLQVLFPAIAAIVFWKYRGATPGKMAISARIVDAATLGAPATGKLVLRYVAYLVSTLPLGLGFLWIGIDRRKQGFHDKIAGTLVIYDDD